MGKGASLGEEAVVADSGRAGEVAAGQAPVGRGKMYIDSALLEAYSAPAR
jgi:hypothetical protein